MSPTTSPALDATILWITLQRSTASGRACRDYSVCDATGRPLLTARAFNWERDIAVTEPGAARTLLLRRSRWFPVTGRFAALELPSHIPLGIIRRNGAYYDAAGRLLGRFRDARSARARATESILQGTFDAIMGGESTPSGPDSFVLEIAGAVRGTLTRAPLPFASEPRVAPSPRLERLARLLPARVRQWLRLAGVRRGWKFERQAHPADDPRLHVAAALIAIELSR